MNARRTKELGHGSGDDFVARIDLDEAALRFRNMLEASSATTPDAEAAIGQYKDLNEQWGADEAGRQLGHLGAAPPEGFEIAGSIRWLDVSKGYGFIVPEGGMPDDTLDDSDLSSTDYPAEPPEIDPNPAMAKSQWETATVSSFDPEQGFGFLSLGSQGPPIYCHIETVLRCGFTELRPGQLVQIRWREGERGPTVVEMRQGDERHR